MKIIALQRLRGWMIYYNKLLSYTKFLHCFAVVWYLALFNLRSDHPGLCDACCVLMGSFWNEPRNDFAPPIIGIHIHSDGDFLDTGGLSHKRTKGCVCVFTRLVFCSRLLRRVAVAWAQSSCGRLVTEGGIRTAVTATATPTASIPCPSAAPPRTETSPGTARPAPPPSPPPTARETSMRNR